MVFGGGAFPSHRTGLPHARTARMNPVFVSIQVDPVGPAFFAPSSSTEMPGQTAWYVPRMDAPEPGLRRLRDVSSTTVAEPPASRTLETTAAGKSPSRTIPFTFAE